MSSEVTVTTMEIPDAPATSRFKLGIHEIPPGLLKLFQIAVGATCIGIFAQEGLLLSLVYNVGFFVQVLSMAAPACLITTFLLLVSYLVSKSTASLLQKTLFELLYHSLSSFFFLVGSIALFDHVAKLDDEGEPGEGFISLFRNLLTNGILGLTNSVLYGLSAFCNYHALKTS